MGIIFFDTETTGFQPGQICQLSMIHEENRNFIKAYNYYFKVDKMDEGAQATHGYSIDSLEKLSNNRIFRDSVNELYPILSSNMLCAHNLPFDEKFLSSEFWRCGISFMPSGRTDTMQYFTDILKIPAKSKRHGPYKYPKLSEVAHYFKLDQQAAEKFTKEIFNDSKDSGFHDSMYDTAVMYILVNLQREVEAKQSYYWHDRFCREINITI